MRYSNNEILDNDTIRSDSDEEGRQYQIEFAKAKKRLPKEFLKIYESFHRFDDADVIDISIITDQPGFTKGLKKTVPTIIKLVIRDADMRDTLCEILIGGVKETAFIYSSYEGGDFLDDYLYDRILVEDDKHLSWEIEFAGYARLRMVFKELSARLLSKEEVEEYKRPLHKRKGKKASVRIDT